MTATPRYDKSVREIRAWTGGTFLLELPARPTSGYVWSIVRDPGITHLAEERMQPVSAAAGAPAIQQFQFLATRAGDAKLVLEYRRPWESTPLERLEVNVIVENGSAVDTSGLRC